MTSPGTRPASQRLVTEETVDDHITRVGNATYAPVDAVDSKVDKTTSNVRLYGTDGLGNQATVGYGTPANANTIAYRTTNGRLKVGAPTDADDATTKAYVDALGGGGGASSLGELSVASAPIPAPYGPPITITEAAASTTSITDGVLTARDNPLFRYVGLNNRGDTGSHYYFARLTGSPAGTASNPWLVMFDYEGSEFEIKAWTASSPRGEYRLWIDGQPTTPMLTALGASGAWAIKVRMPNAQRRRIVLEVDSGFNFGGIWTPPGATLSASSVPVGAKKLAVLGDSLVWGAGIVASGQQALGFAFQLGRLLGWDVTNLGIGGTGWATDVTTGVTAVRFSQRLADLYTAAPDVVLIPGSQNDKAAAAGAINTEVSASIAAIKTNLPNAKIVLASTLFPATPTTARGGFDTARRAVMDAEVKSAVDATTGVSYIDASGWFTGTGRVGTPDGGNADWFRTALDWAHPSAEGHTYLARRFAAELKRIVG
ncbi:hypothetical protein IM25_21255 [Rhodococcus sp. p52]|uniref:SGNH/GDSL hydrolase family protein n=1 Tax=Rhodococcus sp. p52 TaxID=935199 RepID=UPI00051A85B0|nr:SGNH/GDSL hydrolase family protein [Rhodococcus sp. p52]AOD23795.1 hypothetical protein IM25_21255 [Rhodococcus sp. p52]